MSEFKETYSDIKKDKKVRTNQEETTTETVSKTKESDSIIKPSKSKQKNNSKSKKNNKQKSKDQLKQEKRKKLKLKKNYEKQVSQYSDFLSNQDEFLNARKLTINLEDIEVLEFDNKSTIDDLSIRIQSIKLNNRKNTDVFEFDEEAVVAHRKLSLCNITSDIANKYNLKPILKKSLS